MHIHEHKSVYSRTETGAKFLHFVTLFPSRAGPRLTLMYYCTEVSDGGNWKCEPCMELRVVLPEAGKDYEDSEMEVLETMKMYDLCGFDEVMITKK
jgi:hypothetical protein